MELDYRGLQRNLQTNFQIIAKRIQSLSESGISKDILDDIAVLKSAVSAINDILNNIILLSGSTEPVYIENRFIKLRFAHYGTNQDGLAFISFGGEAVNEMVFFFENGKVSWGTPNPPKYGTSYYEQYVQGQIRASHGFYTANGTKNTPRFSFRDDISTGIYRPANNKIGFTVGGVEALGLMKSGAISCLDMGISGIVKAEDDMASNSPSHLVTQKSIKTYVDTKVEKHVRENNGDLIIENTEEDKDIIIKTNQGGTQTQIITAGANVKLHKTKTKYLNLSVLAMDDSVVPAPIFSVNELYGNMVREFPKAGNPKYLSYNFYIPEDYKEGTDFIIKSIWLPSSTNNGNMYFRVDMAYQADTNYIIHPGINVNLRTHSTSTVSGDKTKFFNSQNNFIFSNVKKGTACTIRMARMNLAAEDTYPNSAYLVSMRFVYTAEFDW